MAAKKTTKQRTKKATKRLVLLDSHAILHRAYHALPDFTSANGEATGGLYGLAAMLMKIIQELKPDYIVAAYDLPEPTYRHEAYDAYKAGRAKAEDDLVEQIERSRDIFEAFNIPIYEKAGFEADDILGTIVEQMKGKKSVDIVIASGDMDTLQLVDDKRVQVYTLRKGLQDTVLYDEKQVVERFGFGPELLPDFKGLRGDPSDNIPGIPGIGEKTATTLITTFGSVEHIYKALNKGAGPFEKVGIKARVQNLLEEHQEDAEFSKMLGTIRRDAPIRFELPKKEWREALELAKVQALFRELSFRTLAARVQSLFGAAPESAQEEPEDEPGAETVDEQAQKETAVALWLLRSDVTNPSLEDILHYAKTDSFEKAREKIFKELERENLQQVYEEIERPLIPIVEQMKERGVKVDRKLLEKLSKTYQRELDKIERKIFKLAGEEFNVNSPRQLGEVLFEKLELSPKNHKKTSTGQRSTRESELEKLKGEHPIIEEILAYRELQKLLSTYIDTIPRQLDKNDRLHASFLQAGTTTGRMASQHPNLQNIPIRSELGRAIRAAFIAEKGYCLAAFDYSQVELRIAAFLSGDEKLIKIFKEGGDVHAAVAAELFSVSSDQVDYEMRRKAKVINFGIIYGMGVNALRATLETSRKEAQEFLNAYFEKFSTLAAYLDEVKASAARSGYTQTLFGRKRRFEGIRSKIPYVRAAAERMAINAPIQGTEADIVKLAMVRVEEMLEREGFSADAHLLLQVHDELVYELDEKKAVRIAKAIEAVMEDIVPEGERRGVPIIVDGKVGKNWEDMKPLS